MSPRPLLSYAVLAESWGSRHDIVTGLVPLFLPLAARRAGQSFSPEDFARDLDEYYGLRVSAKIATDWVTRLAAAGLIKNVATTSTIGAYVYCELNASPGTISEAEILELIKEFASYANKLFARHNIAANPITFEQGFFERVVSPAFLQLIARKGRVAQEGSSNASRLRLPGRDAAFAKQDEEARLDAVVAAFFYESLETNPKRWALIETIAAGALLAEVVLTFQEASQKLDLSKVQIYFDAPLLMDLLRLGDGQASLYAAELYNAIRAAGGQVATFPHCVEEIKDNLDGALRQYETGEAFGPTGRRLGQPAHHNYVRDVRSDVENALKKENVTVDRFDFGRLIANCTTAQEALLCTLFGSFFNLTAQQRDAASVSNVLRLRRGLSTPASRPSEWRAIFVTENERVARASHEFAQGEGLGREEDIAPAVTDRFLSGLIWAAMGGNPGIYRAQSLLRIVVLPSALGKTWSEK